MTEPTDTDRAKAGALLWPFGVPHRLSHDDQERWERVAAALAAERAAAVADLRTRVLALAEEMDGAGSSPVNWYVDRLRAAVTDTTGGTQ